MELSLSKLPWYGQIGAFVLVCAGAVYGFWHFYVAEMQADIELRQTRLTALRADIARGVATARRLPEFEAQVAQLERGSRTCKQVLPEEKDVADILRRIQGLATQSNLVDSAIHAAGAGAADALRRRFRTGCRPRGRTTTSGSSSIAISKFPRIINVGEISIQRQDAGRSRTPRSRRVRGDDVRAAGSRRAAQARRARRSCRSSHRREVSAT